MRWLATALLFSVLPTVAQACTGTVLVGATNTSNGRTVTVTKGQQLKNLDHVLQNPVTGQVLVCAGDHCYPAIGVVDGAQVEVVDLAGCKIAEASTDEGALKRHEIEQPVIAPKVDPPEPKHADALDRKMMLAASVVLSYAAQYYVFPPTVDAPDRARSRARNGAHARFTRTGRCKYQIESWRADANGDNVRNVAADFSMLDGTWTLSRDGYFRTLSYRARDGIPLVFTGVAQVMDVEQIKHDVDFILSNGCGDSVRGPDPY